MQFCLLFQTGVKLGLSQIEGAAECSGLNGEKAARDWTKLRNEGLHDYSGIETSRTRWAGHVVRMGEKRNE